MTETLGLARPARFRISLRDDAAGAMPLELPSRRMWPAALVCAVGFGIFAAIAWAVIVRISTHDVRSVFDLMFVLFEGFWVLGWSVAVVILGALTVLLFFYGESARIQSGRLVHVPRLGPLNVITEYELHRVRNVRVENAPDSDQSRVRFDYDGGARSLGDAMPRPDAERIVAILWNAAAGAGATITRPRDRTTPVRKTPIEPVPREADGPPPAMALSGLALIGANLIPLAGVLFLGWDLASVLVLFWAESAIIGFYTALKMAIVGKLAAIVAVPFFIGHFFGFLAGHFLLLYSFFVRGFFVRGFGAPGAEPDVRSALAAIFVPLWPSLAVLGISHGVSFVDNFVKGREYVGATMKGLMTAPYNRILVMQITLLLGGWVIMLLGSPVPALGVLVVLKTALDFSAHRAARRQIR